MNPRGRARGWAAALALCIASACSDGSTNPGDPSGGPDDPGTGSVAGVVRDDAGAGVARAPLTLSRVGDDAALAATTDPSGRFAFDPVQVGEWTVRVEPPAGFASVDSLPSSETVEVAEGETESVELELTRNLHVLVWSDADSATVPDVPVEVVTVPSGELVAADVTNALGRAVFSVEAGVYDVRAELPPGSVLQPGFTNPARVEVPPGEVGWASFNLE